MEKFSIFVVVLLTLVGTPPTSANNDNEGVNIVDGAEESFVRRFSIDDDLHNKTATIELHLTSIDMLVSVRVDSVNNVTMTYSSGKFAINDSEPEKEKENIPSNYSQNTSNTNMSLPRPKTIPKEQIIQRESAINSSTWLEMAWNGFSSAVQSFIKWLYIGIEWPKDINSDMFARRTVTGVDLTCPADGSVNHSMFNLDIAEMEENTCPVTSRIPVMKLHVVPEDSKVDANRATSTETGVSMSHGTENTATAVKEKEPSKRPKPSVVFIGHSEHEWPELLPKFVTVGHNPEIVSASPLQRGNDDSVFPDSMEEEEDDSYWPEFSAPEVASIGYYGMLPRKTSSENPDNTDNVILPETCENPATKDTELTEEIPSNNDDEPWWLKTAEDGTPRQIDLADTRLKHMTTHPENTGKCTEGFKESDVNQIPFDNYASVTGILYNVTLNDEDLVCPIQDAGIGYWKQEDDNNFCIKDYENPHLSLSDMTPLISPTRDDTPLKPTRIKEAKDKRMADKFIDENVFCLAGKNQSGPETHFCTKRGMKRSSDTWFTINWWERSMSVITWRKSSGVPLQATRVHKPQDKWTAAEKPINESVMCRAGSNKRAPEEEFCAADSPWLTTKLWHKGVVIMTWLNSNETYERARNVTDYYWTSLKSWTWQDTFNVMMTIWMIDYCFMVVYIAFPYVKHGIMEVIRQLRLWRERRLRKLEGERERLRQLELKRERAAQPKSWRPKPPKKRRPNYCGRLQKWN